MAGDLNFRLVEYSYTFMTWRGRRPPPNTVDSPNYME